MKCVTLLVVLGGLCVEGERISPVPLPSPPPLGTGLYSVILKLQTQVGTLEQLHEKDRTRLRRLEKKGRQYRDTAVKSQAEVVQLRQHIVELKEKFSALEELATDVKLDISRLDFENREIKKELMLLKETRPVQNDQVFEVQQNMSRLMSDKEQIHQNYKSLVKEVESLHKNGRQNNDEISYLKSGFKKVVKVLTNHVKDVSIHCGNSSQLSSVLHSNNSLLWDSEDLESGDGSGDMGLETIPSREHVLSSPDEEDGSGDPGTDDLDSLITSLPSNSSKEWLKGSDLTEWFLELEEKVNEKLDKVNAKLEARTDSLLRKHDSYFEQEILKRDTSIEDLEGKVFKLSGKVHSVESRVLSIQLGDFMQKLQESLINFTQNVITLDQWKMASDQIINSTQFNQEQIGKMTAMIMNNSRSVGQMDWKLNDQRLLNDQQYRVLRMHIIRLNNSVQDLREHVEYLGSIKAGSPGSGVQGAPSGDILSRIEDLALQIIYNENRIANMESKVLNTTLLQCQKSNKDLYQDSRLLTLEKKSTALSSQGALLNELIKRVDRAVYRVHTVSKNNTVSLSKLWSKANTWQLYIPIVNLVQQEVNNLLTQVPTDCDGYYKQGFRESRKYIIYPRQALQSVFVHCSMEADGGWTVIQRRIDGKVDFRRPWAEYAVGFGSADNEYWIGNEFIHLITVYKNYSLRIEMTDVFDGFWQVDYEHFAISTKEENYKLSIQGYHGNATDGLDYSNGMAFSTQDKDNDLSSTHCALYFTSGWWYRHCQYSNLNGRYETGIVWFSTDWQDWIQMKQTVMKIKPNL